MCRGSCPELHPGFRGPGRAAARFSARPLEPWSPAPSLRPPCTAVLLRHCPASPCGLCEFRHSDAPHGAWDAARCRGASLVQHARPAETQQGALCRHLTSGIGRKRDQTRRPCIAGDTAADDMPVAFSISMGNPQDGLFRMLSGQGTLVSLMRTCRCPGPRAGSTTWAAPLPWKEFAHPDLSSLRLQDTRRCRAAAAVAHGC